MREEALRELFELCYLDEEEVQAELAAEQFDQSTTLALRESADGLGLADACDSEQTGGPDGPDLRRRHQQVEYFGGGEVVGRFGEDLLQQDYAFAQFPLEFRPPASDLVRLPERDHPTLEQGGRGPDKRNLLSSLASSRAAPAWVLQPSIFEQPDARGSFTLPPLANRVYGVTTDLRSLARRPPSREPRRCRPPSCLGRGTDLVGDRSSPGWVIGLVGMRRGLRISADRIHQSDVEVPIEHTQVAAPDQPELAASLHNHLTAARRR